MIQQISITAITIFGTILVCSIFIGITAFIFHVLYQAWRSMK